MIHSINGEWEPQLANPRMTTIRFDTNWRELFKTKKMPLLSLPVYTLT